MPSIIAFRNILNLLKFILGKFVVYFSIFLWTFNFPSYVSSLISLLSWLLSIPSVFYFRYCVFISRSSIWLFFCISHLFLEACSVLLYVFEHIEHAYNCFDVFWLHSVSVGYVFIDHNLICCNPNILNNDKNQSSYLFLYFLVSESKSW